MAGWHHNLSGMNGENIEKIVSCLVEDSNSDFSVRERKITSTDYVKKLGLLSFRADRATRSNSEFPELIAIWH
jgi:predicted secreted protein